MSFIKKSITKAGLNLAAISYNASSPNMKQTIYNSTFLVIMGPMKPVSDLLCKIYSSQLITRDNKVRIEILINRIYDEIQKATTIEIPNAKDWITLLLSMCKSQTCAICDQTLKTQQVDEVVINKTIADKLTTLSNLVGSAKSDASFLYKVLQKYKDKVLGFKSEFEKAFTVEAFAGCIKDIKDNNNNTCFVDLTKEITSISNEIKTDPGLKVVYDKIQSIKNELYPQPLSSQSPSQSQPAVGGKTRRRKRNGKTRRRKRSGIMRRCYRYSSVSVNQRKHKNKLT